MSEFPKTLDDAIAQAQQSTLAALDAGCQRVQIDLAVPEIALQGQAIARSFADLFASYDSSLKILFPDTGASALARRDWGETSFSVSDLGSSRTPIEMKISDEDRLFLVVCPSAVEVGQVEKLCNLALDRPVILLAPQLESVAIVGIGYAARQLRDRFLSTLETSYYLRPFEGGAVVRAYPGLWQVWLEKEGGEYELLTEESQQPMGEALERLLLGESESQTPTETSSKVKKKGFLDNLQQMLRALTQ
ncbi:MAG: DUF1995 family protein [Cyanobacteriota bacterium]|nr:DUF1995 family protein [Cyanobacteriota bacterium]